MGKKTASPEVETPAEAPVEQTAGEKLVASLGESQVGSASTADVTPEPPSLGDVPEASSGGGSDATTEGKPDFLTTVKELGFADVDDEQAARDRVLEAFRQQKQDLEERERRLKEAETFATYGREYLDKLRQTKEPEKPAAPAAKSVWPEYPTIDPQILRKYRTVGPDGQEQWSPEAPASVRAEYERYLTTAESWSNDLIYRPRQALKEPIRAEIEEYLSEVLGVPLQELPQRLDVTGEQRIINQFLAENQERLFVRDPITNKLNQEKYTPYGQAVSDALEEAQRLGIPTRDAQLKYATAIANAKHPPSTSAAIAPKREEVRREIARKAGATGLPQRGTPNPESRPQNRNVSPGQALLDRLNGTAAN